MIISLPLNYDILDFITGLISDMPVKPHDFSGIMIVFPNKKPGLHLLQRLARKSSSYILPPRIYSIDDLFRHLYRTNNPDGREISALEAVVRLWEIIKDRDDIPEFSPMSISAFYEWGMEIYKFFEDLFMEKVSQKEFKEALSCVFAGSINENDVRQKLFQIYESYTNALESENTATKGYMYNGADGYICKGFTRYKSVIFAGFFDPTKSELILMKNIMQVMNDSFYYIIQNDSRESYINTGMLSEHLNPQVEYPITDFDTPNPEIKLIEGFDTHSQILGVRDELSRENAHENTCIVLPEPSSLIPALYDIIPALEAEFNISLGYPVFLTPLYKTLQKVLNLHKNAVIEKDRNYYYPVRLYIELLQDGLMRSLNIGKDEELSLNDIITKVIQIITENEVLKVFPDEICGLFEKNLKDSGSGCDNELSLINKFHEIFLFSIERCISFEDVINSLFDIIRITAEKSNITDISFGPESVEALLNRISEIFSIKKYASDLKIPVILELLQKMLGDSYMVLTGSPLAPLQVLGILETRCLNFDRIYILNFNENSLPDYKSAEPLVPDQLRKLLKTGHRQRKIEIYRYHANRIIQASKKAVLVYDNSRENEKSRFIEEILWNYRQDKHLLPESNNVSLYINPRFLKDIKREKSPAVLKKLAGMTYTATKIDTYLTCPLRFYFNDVLGMGKSVKDNEIGEITHLEIGTFAHELLEYSMKLYKTLTGRHMTVDKTNFLSNIHNHFDSISDQYFKNKHASTLFLFKMSFLYYLDRFLLSTLDYLKNYNIEILDLEKTINRTIDVDNRSFSLSGKIDRIDRVNDFYCIIDYKTGNFYSHKKDNPYSAGQGLDRCGIRERVNSFQLPLYLYLFDEYPADAFYLSFKNISEKSSGIFHNKLKELYDNASADKLKDSEKTIKNQYLPLLKDILREINNPDIPFTQDRSLPSYCHYCPYRRICL